MKNRTESRRLKDVKFTVATRLLDQIGGGMYSKYTKAISELVVNGYDADANSVTVDIKVRKRSHPSQGSFYKIFEHETEDRVVIRDNGEGMDEQDIREAYFFLGSGQKRTRQRTPIYHRLPIGNKGIGKLAGFGMAKRIEVTTVKNEKRFEFFLDRDELDSTEKMGKLSESVLDRAPIQLKESSAKGESPGTILTIRKIRPECGKIDEGSLMGYLAHELPLSQDFKILVNGRPCTPIHIPAIRRINIDYNDPTFGQINGEIIVAKSMLKNPGVLTTVRGRIVGNPSLFGLTPTSFTYHVGDLISGTVEVESFDPPDSTDEISVIKTDREGFIESHPKYAAYYNYMTERLTEICKDEEKKHQAKADAEKKAKVDEAIKTVAQDFNAYDDFLKRKARQENHIEGREDISGKTLTRPDLEIETKRKLDRHRDHTPIPPEIMKEINAILGSGRLRFKNQSFEIKQHPLGIAYYECRVVPSESVILINVDHPTYDQGIREKCIEIVVFRAIAARLAHDESESPEEMYEELDQMLRFQAERMVRRRTKNSDISQPLETSRMQ